MTLIALLSSLYVVLSFLEIEAGVFKISLASFVIIFSSLTLPFVDSLSIAIIGTFIQQLKFGLGPTTILWMLPIIIRALFISSMDLISRRFDKNLYERKVLCIITIVISSIIVTILNTAVMYFDALIYQYPYEFVFITAIFRALINIGITVCETILIFIIIKPLNKGGMLPERKLYGQNKSKNEVINDG